MYIVVFITAPTKREAKKIANVLIKNKMAACVNITDKIDSLFWWKGKINSLKEVLLIVKSKKEKLPQIIKFVKSAHSYSVPEIISLSIGAGLPAYLRWIDDSLR